MHSLLHDIPRFLIFFLEDFFLIFNQMLSIRAFGRRALQTRGILTESLKGFASCTYLAIFVFGLLNEF